MVEWLIRRLVDWFYWLNSQIVEWLISRMINLLQFCTKYVQMIHEI